MRLRTIRAGRGVTVAAAVLAAALTGALTGGVAVHAVPSPAGVARLAAGTGTTPATTPTDGTADGARTALARFGAAPTAALHGQVGAPAGTTVVSVRFRPGVRAASVAAAAPLALGRRAATAVTRSVAPRTNAATYSVPSADTDAFLTAMRTRGDVLDASPEVFAQYDTMPNDPLFYTSLSTDRDQFTYYKDINVASGWSYRGSAAVKIAVVDSGIDVGHPDLAAKIAAGDRWNTVSNTSNVTDRVGHGTFVAGIAGASTNNGVGIAGVGWTAKLMAVKVADANGGLALTDIAEGIRWAVDHGAKVVNLSLGATSGSAALADAVAYTQAQGAIVVASAGNSGQEGNPKTYPAAYPGVISVGATDARGHRAWFSEHGSWVSIGAPGIRVISTTVRAGSTFWPAGPYGRGDGTSFAAPMVAGAAALVWERAPASTAAQVKDAVLGGASGYAGLGLGAGGLSVSRAMSTIVPTTAPTITAPASGATVTDQVNLVATSHVFGSKIMWFLDGVAIPSWSSSDSPLAWDPRGWPQGTHTLEARNCTGALACAASGTSVPVTIAMPATSISSPADGDTVGGAVTFAGGSSDPYSRYAVYEGTTRLTAVGSLEANFTGHDGPHAVELVACDPTGTRCDGVRSPVVHLTAASADVTAGPVTNPSFSPDGNGVKDSTSLEYTTAGTQTVSTSVVRDEDGVVVRTFPTQSLAAGTHTLTWDGSLDAGVAGTTRTPHTLRVETTDGSGRTGLVTGKATPDATPPAFTISTNAATSFYPVVDGYKDTFTPPLSVSETSTFVLLVKNASGATVRTVQRTLTRRDSTISWDGKDAGGTLAPAGTYTWTVRATDPAGNTYGSRARTVDLLRTKLTNRTATVTKAGTGAYGVNAGPACARVTTTGSSYARGVWLRNGCAKGGSGSSAVFYHLTMPAATRYTGWTIRTTGRSHSAPVDLSAGLFSTQTNSYDLTYPVVRVPRGATSTRSLRLGRITTGGHGRTVDLVVLVSNARLAPLTDWDLKSVSVTVSYQVLA